MEASFRTNTYAASITRAANTTDYAAGDIILGSTNLGFVFGAPAADESKVDDTMTSPLRIESLTWSGEINAISFLIRGAAVPDFKVHLYTTELTLTDNDAFAQTAAQFENYKIGTVAFTTEDFWEADISGSAYWETQKKNIDLPFNFKKNDALVTGEIFMYMEVGEAWTPVSAAVLRSKLVVTSD